MKPYELTYIISSAQKSEDAQNLTKEVEAFIQEKGGVIVKSEKTVPQSLAFPIKKQSSGYFAILEFQIEEKEIKGIKEKLGKEVNVLRSSLVVKMPAKPVKKRRTRKPITENPVYKETSKKEKVEEVKIEDIDKKLDEMLSE